VRLSFHRSIPKTLAIFRTESSYAVIRYVLDDDRIDILNIGMRLKEEVDANVKTLAGDVTYTSDDQAILAEFCAKAYDSDAIRAMKIDYLDDAENETYCETGCWC